MSKLTIDDVDVAGKRVLVRVDFNVPLSDGSVADDTRIRAALPTIRAISDRGGVAVIMSHLGRPKGKPDPAYSLRPVAAHLQKLLEKNVTFVEDTVGEGASAAVAAAAVGDVILLENTRFNAGETSNDDAFAAALGALGDLYVNDAFGAAHRAHASTEGITRHVERSVTGYLLEKEIRYLSAVLEDPEHPFVAVLGGAKVSDKISLIETLLPRVDKLLVGGAMSYTFLKALGATTGTSLVEDDKLETARTVFNEAAGKIVLPEDHVVASAFDNEAERRVVTEIPDGFMGLDIGPQTVKTFGRVVRSARTVVWNGPMGVFEMSNFAGGTMSVARAMAEATTAGAMTVVGGGDSVAAITQGGYDDDVSHVSTGGGAMLEFLEGKTLPGVAALNDA